MNWGSSLEGGPHAIGLSLVLPQPSGTSLRKGRKTSISSREKLKGPPIFKSLASVFQMPSHRWLLLGPPSPPLRRTRWGGWQIRRAPEITPVLDSLSTQRSSRVNAHLVLCLLCANPPLAPHFRVQVVHSLHLVSGAPRHSSTCLARIFSSTFFRLFLECCRESRTVYRRFGNQCPVELPTGAPGGEAAERASWSTGLGTVCRGTGCEACTYLQGENEHPSTKCDPHLNNIG